MNKKHKKKQTVFLLIIAAVVTFIAGFFTHTLVSVKRSEYDSLLLYYDSLYEKTTKLEERISQIAAEENLKNTNTKTDTTTTVENSDEYVWITKSGEKYHKENCSSLKKNSKKITLTQAQQSGKEPCKMCFN